MTTANIDAEYAPSRRAAGPLTAAREHGALLALLLAAVLLRFVLVAGGGQFYWPDEARFDRARALVAAVRAQAFGTALDTLVRYPDHNGFTLVAALPAALESAVPALGVRAATLLLAGASLVSIGLTYGIAQRAGAGARERQWAALLMASATTMLYYARHLLPYDSALALALLALWLGIDRRARLSRSFACGLVAGFAFLTYNGYWLLVLTVLVLHALLHPRAAGRVAARWIVAGLAALLLPALTIAVSVARGMPFIESMSQFATTVTQGNFDEGWRLPWAYLWHAEHGLLLVWLLGAGVVIWLAARGEPAARQRGLLWLGAAAGMYALLVGGANGLERFVVYGRLARQMVPFLCLATACAVARLGEVRARAGVAWLLGAVVLAQAAFNFAQPLAQRFPADVQREVLGTYGPVLQATTINGAWLAEQVPGANQRYVLLNTQHLYPVLGPQPAPDGTVLLRTTHPLQFIPYLYEGYNPEERAILRSTDISMRLIDTQAQQP